MKCKFSFEDIVRYTENTLSEEENARIRGHLNSCEKCRRYYGVLTYAGSYAGENPYKKEDIKVKVRERIDVGRYRGKRNQYKLGAVLYRMTPAIKLAAATVVMFVLVFFAAAYYRSFINGGDSNYGTNPSVIEPGVVKTDGENGSIASPPAPVSEKASIVLYFGNADADGVVAEKREVEISKDDQIEKIVFEELQKGPGTEGLYPVIPNGTKLLDVKTEGDLCTIDLSKEFVDNSPGGTAGESMTLNSVVNSLTGIPNIKRVQFLIEGQKREVYTHAMFNKPFTRNEAIIKTQNSQEQPIPTKIITEKEIKSAVDAKSVEVIAALKEKDMARLAECIHPEKGVCFSPYSHIDIQNDLVFTADKMKDILKDKTVYMWGAYDGSGEPIKLTFTQYFEKFVYDKDFANPKDVGYNRVIHQGNTLVNISEVYPQSRFNDYYFPGFDPKYEGMDWESLRLIFEEYKGDWYLVAIAHGQWTI